MPSVLDRTVRHAQTRKATCASSPGHSKADSPARGGRGQMDGPVRGGQDYSRTVPCGFRCDGQSGSGRMAQLGLPRALCRTGSRGLTVQLRAIGMELRTLHALWVRADGRSGLVRKALPAHSAVWVQVDKWFRGDGTARAPRRAGSADGRSSSGGSRLPALRVVWVRVDGWHCLCTELCGFRQTDSRVRGR